MIRDWARGWPGEDLSASLIALQNAIARSWRYESGDYRYPLLPSVCPCRPATGRIFAIADPQNILALLLFMSDDLLIY